MHVSQPLGEKLQEAQAFFKEIPMPLSRDPKKPLLLSGAGTKIRLKSLVLKDKESEEGI
jgi:hypothetical protein